MPAVASPASAASPGEPQQCLLSICNLSKLCGCTEQIGLVSTTCRGPVPVLRLTVDVGIDCPKCPLGSNDTNSCTCASAKYAALVWSQ